MALTCASLSSSGTSACCFQTYVRRPARSQGNSLKESHHSLHQLASARMDAAAVYIPKFSQHCSIRCQSSARQGVEAFSRSSFFDTHHQPLGLLSQSEGRARRKCERARAVVVRARAASGGERREETKVEQLRQLLEGPGIVQGPACQDALSARLIERAGFKLAFMSGFSVSATRLAAPDAGLISYGEMVDQARLIASATTLPVIGDGDTGYGNAMNVKRTVTGYAQAGMAGILIEDQVSPKACGHTKGRKVVSREEALLRIRAAVDARDEGDQDIVIVARTDARQAVNMEEAIWRAKAFADQGADVVFIDALAAKAEMREFCQALPDIPKMANMLEGGGKSPILTPLELEELGFKLVAYPLSLLGSSIRAMEDVLKALKTGRMPPPSMLPTFDEVKEIVGFNDYYREEERYASLPAPSSRPAAPRPPVEPRRPPVEPTKAQVPKPAGAQPSTPKQQNPETPKPKWTAPPAPSAEDVARRRAEWGLGDSSPASKASTSIASEAASEAGVSPKPAVNPKAVSGNPFEGNADVRSTISAGFDNANSDGTRPREPTATKAALDSAVEAATQALKAAEDAAKGQKPAEDKATQAALDTAVEVAAQALKTAEEVAAQAVLRTAENAAEKALSEAEQLLAATERKAAQGAKETASSRGTLEAQPVEIETADGWKDLSGAESSTAARSDMRGLPGLRGRTIRVRILGPLGEKKLEFNVPAGFLDGLSMAVPAVAGLDLRALLEESLAQRRATSPSGAIVDVESGTDRIQIFLD